jgi:hypothetical protein
VCKRRALAALALAALACGLPCGLLPSAAQASDTAKLEVSFSPYKLGGTTTVKVKVILGNTDGGLPHPVTSFDTRLPPRLELAGSSLGLAICQPALLLAKGLEGCSPNARVGSGSATVDVPFGPEIVSETASVEALIGPSTGENVGVLLYAEGRVPVLAQSIFPGVLVLGSTSLGESLNTEVPVIPTLPDGPDVAVTNMQLSLGPEHLTYYKRVHGKQVGYRPRGVSLPAKCPRGGFVFNVALAFAGGAPLEVSSTVPCPSSRRR